MKYTKLYNNIDVSPNRRHIKVTELNEWSDLGGERDYYKQNDGLFVVQKLDDWQEFHHPPSSIVSSSIDQDNNVNSRNCRRTEFRLRNGLDTKAVLRSSVGPQTFQYEVFRTGIWPHQDRNGPSSFIIRLRSLLSGGKNDVRLDRGEI